jgi:putative ABC transport system permease protein
MSDLKLALIYLRTRLLVTVLTVASVALGLALATVVMLLTRETQQTLMAESGNWNVVVGAKGSPLQLTLNALYYLDAPTGNIDVAVWKSIAADKAVKRVVPVNMGDNYYGTPIVGTSTDFFAPRTEAGQRLLASGAMFDKPFQAVVGAEIARRFRMTLGQQIVGSHGWTTGGEAHAHSPYTVVGILAPTGTSQDRAIYTDYRSVWMQHAHHDEDEEHHEEAAGHHDEDEEHHEEAAGHHDEDEEHHEEAAGHHDEDKEHHEEAAGHHDEEEDHHDAEGMVTALLVQLHQAGRMYRFVEAANHEYAAMATIPVDQVSALGMRFIEPMQRVLLGVAYLVVLVAGLSILISLYLTIYQRRRDIAVLRALGATRGDVFRLITLEAALLAGLGVAGGWLLGHGAVAAGSPWMLLHYGVAPHAWHTNGTELIIAASVWVLGILAGVLPAIMAYRLPVADTLISE